MIHLLIKRYKIREIIIASKEKKYPIDNSKKIITSLRIILVKEQENNIIKDRKNINKKDKLSDKTIIKMYNSRMYIKIIVLKNTKMYRNLDNNWRTLYNLKRG